MMDSTQRALKRARDDARAANVRAAYFVGLRGGTLRDGASDEEQRAFGSGKERRSLGRERTRG